MALALFGSISLFGMVTSYLRMTWKVNNYNNLRSEVDVLRNRYQELERDNEQKQEQLASLQLMASEVSVALGLKRKLEGGDDIKRQRLKLEADIERHQIVGRDHQHHAERGQGDQ